MKAFRLVSVLAIFFAYVLSSCSSDDENNDLVGSWYLVENDESLEFRADGKMIWYDYNYMPMMYSYDKEAQILIIKWPNENEDEDDPEGITFSSYSEVNWNNFKEGRTDVYTVKVTDKGMQWFEYGDLHYTFKKVNKFPYIITND